MLNRVILMGRLVADPELRQTGSGVSVATLRIAVDRDYQAKGKAEKQADFLPCVAWRQTADFVSKYFAKGRMIAVEGSLQSRNYEDKTGAKRTAYEVIIEQAYFADSKPGGGQGGNPSSADPPQASSLSGGDFGSFEEVDTDDGDLPF